MAESSRFPGAVWDDEQGPADRAAVARLSIASAVICVAITVLVKAGTVTDEHLRLLAPSGASVWAGQVWGLVSATFVHVDPFHLAFNVGWVVSLGALVERRLGVLAWLLLLVASSVVASGAQLAVTGETGIGFSGVVYAWAGFAWAARRVDPRFDAMISANKVLLIAWLVLCFPIDWLGLIRIANAAHVGGLLFGFVAGHAWVGEHDRTAARVGAGLLLVVGAMTPFYMPWSAAWWLDRAREPIAAGRHAEALELLEESLARGRLPLALFERARLRALGGDPARALVDYQEVIETPDAWPGLRAAAHHDRALILELQGKPADARAERERAALLERQRRRRP